MKHIAYMTGTAFLMSVLLTGCMEKNLSPYGHDGDAGCGILTVRNVSVTDFSSGIPTRVSNDGVTVTFTSGTSADDPNADNMGVLLINEDGKAFANVSFKYVNNSWVNADGVYYSTDIAGAIAYFPYIDFGESELPSTVEALKAVKKVMNGTTVEFAEKDLLVDEIENVSADGFSVNFSHAFSMIVLSGEMSVNAGDKTYTYLLDLSDVAFTIGNTQYIPDVVGGRYVYLADGITLKPDDFRYFYTMGDKAYVKTVGQSLTLAPDHSYTFPCPVEMPDGGGMAAGDFFCTDEDGQIVIIPNIASAVPAGLECKGIVFHVMDNTVFASYAELNGITVSDCPGFNGYHGLAVSLRDGGSLGSAADFSNFLLKNMVGWDSKESLNGYRMTRAMQDAATEGVITSFTALNGHDVKAAESSTEWFVPSFMELAVLVRGGDGSVVSSDGRALVNSQIDKAGGVQLVAGNIPTVTFGNNEQGQNLIWFVTGSDGAEFSYPFAGAAVPGETFRPICAF